MNLLLKRLLFPNQIEYLVINQDFMILEKSLQVQRFADLPELVKKGHDLRLSFPELIGCESILMMVLNGEQKYFELKGIGRGLDATCPFYFDLFVVADTYQDIDEKHLVVICEDTTDRMILEQTLGQKAKESQLLVSALSSSQKYIKNILESIPEPLIVTNIQGKIKSINQVTKILFQYEESELIGQYIQDLIANELYENFADHEHYEYQKIFTDREIIFLNKNKQKMVISFSCSAINDRENHTEELIYIGRNITEKKQDEKRLQMQYEVTNILAGTNNVPQAIYQILQAICQCLEWDIGELWIPNGEYLQCCQMWVNPQLNIPEFIRITEEITFKPQEDLPGSVWATGNPQWLNDVLNEPNFLRSQVAADCNINSAFGFAIQSDNRILAVMTFLSQLPQKAHPYLLPMIHSLGCQIGQFMERKQTENALKLSEEKFRKMFEESYLGMAMISLDGYFLQVNQAFCDMVGYEPLELTKLKFYDLTHPDDMLESIYKAQEAFSGNTPYYQMEKRYLNKQKEVLWVKVTASIIHDENQHILYAVKLIENITKSKETQQALSATMEALEREKEQLREIIKNAPIAMAMFDTKMRYIAHSHKWLENYRLGNNHVIGRSHYELLPNIAKKYKSAHQKALQGESLSNPEDLIEFITGEKVYIRWAIQPWREPNGNIGGIIIVSDIINELIEAREAAIEASKFKSQFLANMSHEIRTPMNGVIGMTGLLLETNLTPQQREFVQPIRSSADNLLTIINEILDFSKLEAGQIELENLEFDLNYSLENITDLLAINAQKKGLELNCMIANNVSRYLQGDELRLKQIITNLVGNAIKFTPKGEVIIKVTVKSENIDTISLLFMVKDTGIGIADKHKKKLFQSFSQVDASDTRKYGGTGLGLAISKQLVELMGGRIGVESTEGQGTIFWFTLTFTKQKEPQTTSQKILPLALVQQKILVVSHNSTNRQIITDYLINLGLAVASVNNAADAISILQESVSKGKPYHIAIIDLHTLDIKEQKLAKIIKNDPTIAKTKSIKLTPLSHQDNQQLETTEFDSYLLKPVKLERLVETLITLTNPTTNSHQIAIVKPEIKTVKDMNYHSTKILVVEDNLINQKVAINQLKLLGYKADCAGDGNQALTILAESQYDIVFMDCQMPILDGYSATQELRKRENQQQHTIVIAMTANAMKEDREKCIASGMDDYLSKPVKMDELSAILNKWVITEPNVPHKEQKFTDLYQLINQERLEEICGDDQEFTQLILTTFLTGIKNNVELVTTAVKMNNYQEVANQAHQIKGTSGNIGCETIQNLGLQLETKAQEQNLQGSEELITSLTETISILEKFINI
jgi:PAS domain S-box-containing protein